MKFFLTISLSILSLFSQAQNFDFFDATDELMKRYVSNNRVDYSGIKSDPALTNLIDHLKNDPIPTGKEKAYLINAYNLFVINKIAQAYPVQSPMDDGSFFTGKTEFLNGEKISLDFLENGVLRKEHLDPRLHFVLVCGAIGCPPIVNFAYRPEHLESQLESQAKKALNNSGFVYAKSDDKAIYLSEIFNWYTSDFGKNNAAVIDYINTYRTEPFDKSYKIQFYPYNWALNDLSNLTVTQPNTEGAVPAATSLQQFNAGSLLGKGRADITLFNTMYTENKNNWQGQQFSGYRTTFMTHLLQLTLGVSKNKRFNIGLDLTFRSAGRSSDSTFSGISGAFQYKNNDSSRVGLTSAGLRIKWQPFKSVSDFTLQSTLMGPTVLHAEGRSPDENGEGGLHWADWNRITWWNQFFYTKSFGDFQFFGELDFLYRFKIHESQIGSLDLPLSAFFSYFPTKKITVYAMTQHVHRLTNHITPQDPVVTDWIIPSSYTASGLGFKYQILSNLNVELLYTNFWRGRNSGLGSTFNIGIKYLTK